MKPRISVVMPVYNGEKYLGEAIESILQQTFKDFELIIINDHSTDSTVEIVQKYLAANSNIILLHNQDNRGVRNTLNTGLRKASGAYIARADADDINLPDRLQIQYDFMEAHPEIAVCGGGYAPFTETTQKPTIYHPLNSILLAWFFVTNTRFCHPSVMYRKDILAVVGEYPNQMSEDFAFFSRILRKYRGCNVHRTLIRFREHSGSNTAVFKKEVLDSVDAIYRENYVYYTGSEEGKEIFYYFQSKRYLEWKNIFRVLNINKKILRKIRSDYNISVFNPGHILTLMNIFEYCCIGLLRSTLRI